MLHDSLRALTDDAAQLLEHQLSTGEEIPFEVGDAGVRPAEQDPRDRGGATMFAYRPLTAEFVASHADQLRTLPTFESAAQNLARTRGMIAYLRVRDEPVLDVGELTHARLGALAFLAAVWNDAEHFADWQDRFERAYSELESVALAERLVTTVFIPVHGIVVDGENVNLGAGVELMAPEEIDPECAERFSDSAAGADSFCSISVDAPSDAPTPMAEVRVLARSVLTALRLFKPGSVAMAMTAQADTGGAWHQVSLPFSGRARHDAWHLLRGEDEELRQFLSAVRRTEKRTRVAWALKRFEMGLERGVPAEGLTDFLIALGALLEVRDETGKAAMPARVSALCAREDERRSVRASVEAAFALERLAVDGAVGRADRKRLAKRPPLEVIAETERHLRALLHDLVCGYLSTDLKALADEILTADGEPVGDEDLVPEPVYLEPVPAPGEPPAPDPTATVEFESVFDDTAEITAVDTRDEESEESRAPDVVNADDNVWMLRPAAVEPDEEMRERAEEVVNRFGEAFDATLDDQLPDASANADSDAVADSDEPSASQLAADVPAWDASPERRPVAARPPAPRGDLHAPIGAEVGTGFTFDFKKIDVPDGPMTSGPEPSTGRTERSSDRSVQPRSVEPIGENADGVQAFPIPEFGLPVGLGPAAEHTDRSVGGPSQRESFREIMDENFTPPAPPVDENASTPFARNERAHLKSIENAAPTPSQPRIVHPEIFGSNPSAPVDPQATIEYDALSESNSAEEAAQLAWSEQFLRRGELPEAAAEPDRDASTDDDDAVAEQRPPAEQVEPQLRLVTPEQVDEEPTVKPGSSETARSQSIGPATIEFRPVVPPDLDDPDDFSGAC